MGNFLIFLLFSLFYLPDIYIGAHTPPEEQFKSIGNMALDMLEVIQTLKVPILLGNKQ